MSLTYRPEIDGLRCLAVGAVIMFHLGVSALPGGYMGVDVFFVLSGFLITSLLRRDLEAGTFSTIAFWGRRVRRILPAAVLVLVATILVIEWGFFQHDVLAIREARLPAMLAYANVYYWQLAGSYWHPTAQESPFLHYWSLAVEEQFYLLFPFALWLSRRWLNRRVLVALALITVVSLGLFLHGTVHRPLSTFFLLPTRVWELGAGACLAYTGRPRWLQSSGRSMGATVVGLGLVMLAFLYPIDENRIGVEAVGAVMGTVLLLWGGSNVVSRPLLENPVAVYLGRISFSLYLWHWPVVLLCNRWNELGKGTVTMGWQVVIFGALSVFSYHLVEQPLRRSRRQVVPWILGAYGLVLVMLVAMPVRVRDYNQGQVNRPASQLWRFNAGPIRDDIPWVEAMRRFTKTPPSRHPSARGTFAETGMIIQGRTAEPELVVLGDSHALMWSTEFVEIAETLNITTAFWSVAGVPPYIQVPVKQEQRIRSPLMTDAEKVAYDQARVDALDRWRPKLVVLVTRWNSYDEEMGAEYVQWLAGVAESVVLIESPPEIAELGQRLSSQYLIYSGVQPKAGETVFWGHVDLDAQRRARRALEKVAAGASADRVEIIPITDLYVRGDQVRVLDGRDPIYLDDDHLSDQGTRLARERLREVIARRLGPQSIP